MIHVGGTGSGHYTTMSRNLAQTGGHQWFHMDDSRSSKAFQDALFEAEMRVLFYCRKESGKVPWSPLQLNVG
jgi:hypothetical protein